MKILSFRYVTSGISALLIAGSLAAVAVYGLSFGIEFQGGSILEGTFVGDRPQVAELSVAAKGAVGPSVIQPLGERGVILRTRFLTEDEHQQLVLALGSSFSESRFESVGPVVGEELKTKSLWMALAAFLAVVGYVAFAFRRLAEPVASWQYGLVTLLVLFHDVLLPIGLVAVTRHQVTIPVVVALLTVLGYSVNDTVVVFDRIRENLLRQGKGGFTEVVERSLRQTLARSFATSFTTILVLLALYFLGGESLRDFSLVLVAGIAAGAYSSVFLAPTFLLWFAKRS